MNFEIQLKFVQACFAAAILLMYAGFRIWVILTRTFGGEGVPDES